MSTQLEIVEAQALSLAAEERAQLADRLIASLFDDQGIEEAWAVEVERRVKDIESGHAKLIPASEAVARAPRSSDSLGQPSDGDMNHKRKRPKQGRAGCLLCKPNKLGKGMEKKLGHRGFGKLRKEAAAERDLSDPV